MEEDQIQRRSLSVPSSSSSGEALPSSSSSLTSSRLREESDTTISDVDVQVQQPDGDNRDQNHLYRRHRNHRNRSLHVNISTQESSSTDISDDVWYCLAVLVTFWFFVTMTLILGFYGSFSLKLGPNCSRLITENQLLVRSIQVQQIDGIPGPMLYGFHTTPALDVETTWTDTHKASIQPNFPKEWVYNLNPGSKLDISYDVKNPSSSPLLLVIAQGEESLVEWAEYPMYPSATLSWNIIHGSGRIEQEITDSDTYYIAVGNLNSETYEVQLNITVKALLYNTTEAYFRCSVYNNLCSFSLLFLKKNAVILTSPGPEQAKIDDEWYWYVTLSYGPRWITFITGLGILAIVALLSFRLYNMLRLRQSGREVDNQEPLLSPKDDDLSSWGSSYDSVSNDEEDFEESLEEEGKRIKEGESTTNHQKLCVICFDSPRDCFFLPCGHCASCFTCGSRIAEEAGICPICRRRMKKVRKIFSV